MLIFVRHGETDWNKEKRFQGGKSEVPLNEVGKLQSAYLARALMRDNCVIVLSSPLLRARATAEVIAEYNSIPLEVVDELRELSFGEYEGRLESELEASYGEEFKVWRESNYTLAPPGGESIWDVRDRAEKALEVARKYLEWGSVVICAHQGINMALKALITGDYSADVVKNYRQPNNRIDYWLLSEGRQLRTSEVYGSYAGFIPASSV